MRPDLLDEMECLGKSIDSHQKNTPICYDYLFVLSIRKNDNVTKIPDDIYYLVQINFPDIVTLYKTDQDDVYIIALDFKGEERRCKLEEFFKKISEYFDCYIEKEYMDIRIYRYADIYYNDDKRIEVGKLIFNDGVFHNIPLAHDFIDAITSHQLDKPVIDRTLLQINKKQINCK